MLYFLRIGYEEIKLNSSLIVFFLRFSDSDGSRSFAAWLGRKTGCQWKDVLCKSHSKIHSMGEADGFVSRISLPSFPGSRGDHIRRSRF